MSDDNKILNKGLDALLGESQNNQKTVKEINLNKIPCREKYMSPYEIMLSDCKFIKNFIPSSISARYAFRWIDRKRACQATCINGLKRS